MRTIVPIRYVVLKEVRRTGVLWFKEEDFVCPDHWGSFPKIGDVLSFEDDARGGPRGTASVLSVSRWADGAPVGRGRQRDTIYPRVDLVLVP
mgnify:FL=1